MGNFQKIRMIILKIRKVTWVLQNLAWKKVKKLFKYQSIFAEKLQFKN